MRPIVRGEHPSDDNGNPIHFSKYNHAKRYLIDRIGCYCSYCESRIPANLAIEHIQPKVLRPDLELSWDNFLLGCTNCNSTKSDTPIDPQDYLFPDVDNTFEAFVYDGTGRVQKNVNLDSVLQERADHMIALVGLAKQPPRTGTRAFQSASDLRLTNRVKAYRKAQEHSHTYQNHPGVRNVMLPLLKDLVIEGGFWSIWMHAFKEFPEVQEMLVTTFNGTRKEFFQYLFD